MQEHNPYLSQDGSDSQFLQTDLQTILSIIESDEIWRTMCWKWG